MLLNTKHAYIYPALDLDKKTLYKWTRTLYKWTRNLYKWTRNLPSGNSCASLQNAVSVCRKIVPGCSHWKRQMNARETFKTAYRIFTNHKAIAFPLQLCNLKINNWLLRWNNGRVITHPCASLSSVDYEPTTFNPIYKVAAAFAIQIVKTHFYSPVGTVFIQN